jgi:oxygen-independent coproporphyrinogen-3 oxidase
MNGENPTPAGLYIHIPFCQKKCPYCDFYSITDASMQQVFVDALLLEMRMTGDLPLEFDTVYFGGGTPSVLAAAAVDQILQTVRSTYHILTEPEITLEINPGTVTPAQLREYRQSGINRLNIGVQSFREQNLEFLGRLHTVQEARQAIEWARHAGFENVGLDLIYGLPDQTQNSWRRDLETAAAYVPEHLACYTLTFESGTPLEKQLREGRIAAPDDERVGELMIFTANFLADRDYARYEVSNYSRGRNLRSRHNSKYWSFAPYLGLGPSAHSFIEPERFWNIADVATYVRRLKDDCLPVDSRETLDREQMMLESVYLGLRTIDGIDVAKFEEKFGVHFNQILGEVTAEFEDKGWLKMADTRCVLTLQGILLLDTITAALVDCI